MIWREKKIILNGCGESESASKWISNILRNIDVMPAADDAQTIFSWRACDTLLTDMVLRCNYVRPIRSNFQQMTGEELKSLQNLFHEHDGLWRVRQLFTSNLNVIKLNWIYRNFVRCATYFRSDEEGET